MLPQVQAIDEAVPGYEGNIWWGILAPVGVAGPIVTKLNTDIGAILREADTAKRFIAEAVEPAPSTPQAFGELIAKDVAKWARIAKQADIRAEQ